MPEYNALKAKSFAFNQLRNNSTLIFSTKSVVEDYDTDIFETDFYVNTNALENFKKELENLKSDIDKYIEAKDKVMFEHKLSRLKQLQLKLNNLFKK